MPNYLDQGYNQFITKSPKQENLLRNGQNTLYETLYGPGGALNPWATEGRYDGGLNSQFSGEIIGDSLHIGGYGDEAMRVDQEGNLWIGAELFDNAPFSVTNAGSFIANDATITGDVTINSGSLDIGGSDSTSFHVDSSGNHWAGAATYGSAPFRVSSGGALVSTSATITGAITATSGSFTGSITSSAGTIGGWSIGSTTISTTNVSIDSGNEIIRCGTGNDVVRLDGANSTYRMWIGHTSTPTSAPFRVTKGGAVTATNLTATGTFTGSTLQTGTSGENVNITGSKVEVRNNTTVEGHIRGVGSLGSELWVDHVIIGSSTSSPDMDLAYRTGTQNTLTLSTGNGFTVDADDTSATFFIRASSGSLKESSINVGTNTTFDAEGSLILNPLGGDVYPGDDGGTNLGTGNRGWSSLNLSPSGSRPSSIEGRIITRTNGALEWYANGSWHSVT